MKRTLLIGGMAVLLVLGGSRAEADTISLSPSTVTADPANACSTTETSPGKLEAELEKCFGQIDGPLDLLYKKNSGGGEGGQYASMYDTTFANSFEDANIYLNSYVSMLCTACYLVVRDGNTSPVYLFDISNWDGVSNLALSDFWVGPGQLTSISIYGSARPVPEPATLLLLGTGLGLAALRQRRRRLG